MIEKKFTKATADAGERLFGDTVPIHSQSTVQFRVSIAKFHPRVGVLDDLEDDFADDDGDDQIDDVMLLGGWSCEHDDQRHGPKSDFRGIWAFSCPSARHRWQSKHQAMV
jgi:hypothetical protein